MEKPKEIKPVSKHNKTNVLLYINLAQRQSSWAKLLISELGTNNITQDTKNEIHKYFIGLLFRQASLMGDISFILSNNHPRNWTSAYILFRSLTDDFLNATKIYVAKNKLLEIQKITAGGYNQMFESLRYGLRINKKYHGGNAKGLPTEADLKQSIEDFKNDKKNDGLFLDKKKFIFRKNDNSIDFFNMKPSQVENLKDYQRAQKSNASAYWSYKFLSNVVHFSSWSFDFEERYYQNDQLLSDLFLHSFKVMGMALMVLFGDNETLLKQLHEAGEGIIIIHRQLGVRNLPDT